ncbi:MAG: UDP-4-amino-4,6-dideoxy-N-acetyl-beta-L-altrosamine transaminase [Planctomycetes bacterium]|nr:UDP-4-amino-4,6-dideoxy-N-acetyl-beta-L-altrosamine transaminase [Planctomycetota bacterium]
MATSKPRMIITGASGLLGNNLAWRLKDRWEIVGLYHSHAIRLDGCEVRRVDLGNEREVARCLVEIEPDAVVHCASLANVDQCERDPALTQRVNVDGTRYVARHTPEDVPLVYISTDAVYDGTRGRYSETDPVDPPNIYGRSKLDGERAALVHPRAVVLRTNLFGWNIQDKHSLGEFMLATLRAGKPLKGFKDSIVSTVYTFELAELIHEIIGKRLTGVYNCAASTAMSKYDFALRIAEQFGLDRGLISPISVDDFQLVAPRGKNLSMNVDKLAAALGRRPMSVEESIAAFHEDAGRGVPEAVKQQVSPEKMMLGYGRQYVDDADVHAVEAVFRSSHLTQGPRIGEFERAVCDFVGAHHAVAACNGTAALHIACLAAGLGPGDEVVTSPITFVASSNCAAYCGAHPVFADVDPRTYNLSPESLAGKINERTRAVVPVHFAGQSCDMQAIAEVVREAERRYGRKITIIEDASHALGSKHRGEWVGDCRFSDMATLSFHPVKHITTGEGGMVLTQDDELARRLARFRSHGITSTPSEFANDDVPWQDPEAAERKANPWYYEQIDLGFNYRITDLQCALGVSQMTKLEGFMARRREIVDRYNEAFRNVARVVTPHEEPFNDSNFHLYVLLFDFEAIGVPRAEFVPMLRTRGIQTQVHYIPVHLQSYYRRHFGTRPGDCPNAEAYYRQALSIPLYPALTDDDVERVIDVITGSVQPAG